MRRRLARFVFVFVVGTVAMALGVLTSLTLTPPGRALLARTVPLVLKRFLPGGQFTVGAISGSFLYDIALDNLVVRDTSGVLLADIPRLRARYRLPNLLNGQIVFSQVALDRPVIQLVKHRNGRMNYEDVLGLGHGGKGGGKSPLVEFHRVRVDSGSLSILVPWNPPPEARTVAARDSALRAERIKPGRIIVESPEGWRRAITLSDLTTRMSRLRVATPDHKPFTADLDSLATRVSDPGVQLTDAAGRIRIHGDSVIFSLERGALPDTRFAGGGAVTWPADTVLFDFQVVSSHVNLADLRWVSPDFPLMHGSGLLTARSESGQRTTFDVHDLHLQGPLGRIDGDLMAITDRRRGLGVRNMDVQLRDLDLDAVRPYLDTLPFYGTITGTAKGSGFLDALDVSLDWAFADAKVVGNPVSTIAGQGRVGALPKQGLTFTGFQVQRSDIDLRTVRRIAPAVILDGRLAAVGMLDGPLKNATFQGTAEHRDGALPVSRAEGMVRLDTRGDTLGLTTDLVLNPLAFAGIRPAFPSLTARGELRGRVVSDGTLARLHVNASLDGDIGHVDAEGFTTLLPPKWGADDLLLRFRRLDLAALTGRDRLPTSLNGQLRVTGTLDTLRAPEGDLNLALSSSLARDLTLDTAAATVHVHDSLLTVDTAYAAMRGARAGGSGTLGWTAAHQGQMRFGFAADSLIGFDTLLLAATGQQRDTAPDARPLTGRMLASLQLAGSLDSLVAGGDAAIDGFAWQRYRSPRLTGVFNWTGGARPTLAAGVSADSIGVGGPGGWAFRQAGAQVHGWTDSLDWRAGTAFGAGHRVAGAGRWWRQGHTQVLAFDTLTAALPAHTYRLRETVALTISDSAPALSPLTLAATDGSGLIQMGGRLPGSAPGALTVSVQGLDLRDFYGALQRDTALVDGQLGLELAVGGTAAAPTFQGSARLSAATVGTFQAPFVESTVQYANRQLGATLRFWRTGERVLDVTAQLPLDLAFTGAKRRKIDGPLAVRAHADSIDLGILEALTPAIRQVQGRLSGDFGIDGTWQAPRLDGTVAVHGGTMAIPGLGVKFEHIDGRAELTGDSVVLHDVALESGGGKLQIDGSVRLDSLTKPVLDLSFRADQFYAMNIRNFGTLVASTRNLQLQGPFFGAKLTGALAVNSGVLYFADLVNKRVVNLEDPTIADLVDTTLIRKENLGAGFQNRFLDSLRIDNLQMQLGSDVWLRSAEANVQLGGSVQLSKVGKEYIPSGTVNALRGNYTLKIGPVNRDFTVTEGTVQYEGDLNASLNISAQHSVRSARDEDIPVIAHIQGQLYAPKLTLESAVRPPIAETDLVSYLITGRPASEAVQFGQGGALQTGLAYFSSAFSSELERALIQDLRLPLDLLEIRPGFNVGQTGVTLTQLAAGWQIGHKTFLTLNAGFCPNDLSQVTSNNLGVNLEFRFSHEWRLQGSVEPTQQTCSPRGGFQPLITGRQFGTDILWEREY